MNHFEQLKQNLSESFKRGTPNAATRIVPPNPPKWEGPCAGETVEDAAERHGDNWKLTRAWLAAVTAWAVERSDAREGFGGDGAKR